ncbi:MAG: molybdenum cofactor biosynthesis protein MoaE [Bacteroidia bacterium]|nr:molybdenum cofactor biosynthesis protein MoaE [Bacteroidia bacterium]
MSAKKVKKVFMDGAIQPEFIAASIAGHSAKTEIGAHAIFLGQVRADARGGSWVTAIEYTAYTEMAEEVLHRIREETFSKYPLSCMHIYHGLGTIRAGEISLFVFTSSAHRNEAQEACRELVERIKAEVPVWGREILSDETYIWKENQ